MFHILFQFSPIFIMFALGYGLKRFGFVGVACGGRYLKIVVNIALPMLIFANISRVEIDMTVVLMPLLAMVSVLICGIAAYWISGRLKLERQRVGVLMVGAMIMNLSFLYPFVGVLWGDEGMTWLILLEFGNSLLVLSLVYALACVFGSKKAPIVQEIVRGLGSFPPFWALVFAALVNFMNVSLPNTPLDYMANIGQLLMFLVPFSLGIYFSLQALDWRFVGTGVLLRSGLGYLLALVWVSLFDLQAMASAVVIIACAAPVGFNTLVYATREGLDETYAANLASFSVLLGLVYTPILMWGLSV